MIITHQGFCNDNLSAAFLALLHHCSLFLFRPFHSCPFSLLSLFFFFFLHFPSHPSHCSVFSQSLTYALWKNFCLHSQTLGLISCGTADRRRTKMLRSAATIMSSRVALWQSSKSQSGCWWATDRHAAIVAARRVRSVTSEICYFIYCRN